MGESIILHCLLFGTTERESNDLFKRKHIYSHLGLRILLVCLQGGTEQAQKMTEGLLLKGSEHAASKHAVEDRMGISNT